MASNRNVAAENSTGPKVDPFTGEIEAEDAASAIVTAFGTSGVTVAASDDPMAITREIVNRVLSSETLDEALGQWEVTTSDKLEGRVFEIHGVEFSIFNSESGPMPLARVDSVEQPNGNTVNWVTTAPNLTSVLAVASRTEAFPFTVKIIGSKTSRGYTALHFERA